MHRLVIALVALIGLTGSAFVASYLLLFSAVTDRAAAVAPGDSAIYVNLYLQPSSAQRMNLAGLIGRVPGFADEASLDDKVDQIVQSLLAESGIDYRTDVKPWIGTQIAVAGVVVGETTGISPVLIAEVRDRGAAEAAAARLAASGTTEPTTRQHQGTQLTEGDAASYAFIGDMLVISETSVAIEAVVDAQSEGDTLAQRDEFRSTMTAVEVDHLASAFVDPRLLAGPLGSGEQALAVSTVGAALVAEPGGLRLSGSAPFDTDQAAESVGTGFALGGQPSSLVGWMPADTLAEAVVFGAGRLLQDAEASAGSVPGAEGILSMIDSIRAIATLGLGIDIDADILPLLDREVAVAITDTGGSGDVSGIVLLRPEDPVVAEAAVERIADQLVATGAGEEHQTIAGTEITVLTVPQLGEVGYAVVDGIVVIGAFGSAGVEAAFEAHASGSTLEASDGYARTFELAGERAGNEVYVNIGVLFDMFGTGLAVSDDARAVLGQVGSFGLTLPSHPDAIEFHAVLTVDEP